MTNQSFTTRRKVGASYRQGGFSSRQGAISWGRNQNVVRHLSKNLGPFSYVLVVGMLVLVMGLVYVTQGSKTSSYDYNLSAIDKEISELTAKKESLAVEQARLAAAAASEKNEVALGMQSR